MPTIDFSEKPFGSLSAPLRYRVYAHKGKRIDLTGWLYPIFEPGKERLWFRNMDGKERTLSKRLAIAQLNPETGEVIGICYSPREMMSTTAPGYPRSSHCIGRWFSDEEVKWLNEHPEWPDLLELVDNPVELEDEDGIWTDS